MKRLLFLILAVSFVFIGCPMFQVDPSTNEADYEALGRDTGAYLKATKSVEWIEESREWVDAALLLSDTKLLEGNILQVAYEELLKKYPENADKFYMAKSGLTLLGVKIDVGGLLPEEQAQWLACARAVLRGYYEATK